MSTSGPPALILHGGDETNTIHITFGNRSCGATSPVVQSTRRALETREHHTHTRDLTTGDHITPTRPDDV